MAAYEKKVQAAVAKQELGQQKRGMQINIDAAHRFISNALPDLSAQARQDLKQVCIQNLDVHVGWWQGASVAEVSTSAQDLTAYMFTNAIQVAQRVFAVCLPRLVLQSVPA